jgi:hypothetical protein
MSVSCCEEFGELHPGEAHVNLDMLRAAATSWRDTTTKPPDRSGLDDPWKARYLSSYLLLRIVIGVLGIALPIIVWLGSALLPGGHWALRGSLSSYYYSAMREEFTCSLWVTGFFLITYKAFDRSIENVLSAVAGAAAVLVAFFPTGRPSKSLPLTSLQQGLGETAVKAVHFTSAGIFIVLLAAISYMFGSSEGRRAQSGRFSPTFWRRLHHGCAYAIGVAVLFFVVHKLGVPFGGVIDRHALWLTEVVSVAAFATSWLCKGSELVVRRDELRAH